MNSDVLSFQNLVVQLGENARDHKEYNDAFDAATRWLAEMADRVAECNDTAGDWHTLEDRMDAIKVCLLLFRLDNKKSFSTEIGGW